MDIKDSQATWPFKTSSSFQIEHRLKSNSFKYKDTYYTRIVYIKNVG